MRTIQVNETLTVDVYADKGHEHVAIVRQGGGIVNLKPAELRHVVDALINAGAELTSAIPGSELDEDLWF